MEFDEIYAHYVIKELPSGYFVGPNSQAFRVALRNMAARFTKRGAMLYIEEFPLKEPNGYVIEDAC